MPIANPDVADDPPDDRARTGPHTLRATSPTGAADAPSPVEVPLTWASSEAVMPSLVRLNVAWLLLGVFGLATLLAGTETDPRTGAAAASGLLVSLYLLTVAALIWAGFETRWSTHRRG